MKILMVTPCFYPVRGGTETVVQNLSKELNLITWEKPSSPCFASRIPYNIPINEKNLYMIEQAEEILYSLGIIQSRVRFHYDIARIEVEKNDFKKILENSDEIIKNFKEIGFTYITLDIEGFRSGSLNEVILR